MKMSLGYKQFAKAPPVFVTSANVRSNSNNTLTISGLSGVLAGDRIFIFATLSANLAYASATGYTAVSQSTYITSVAGTALVKTAVGGETGATINFATGFAQCAAMALVYRGVTAATYGSAVGSTGNSGGFPNISLTGGGLFVAMTTTTGASGYLTAPGTARINLALSGGAPAEFAYESASSAGTSTANTGGSFSDTLMNWGFEVRS